MGRLTKAWATDRAGFDNRDWLPSFIERKCREKALRRRSASLLLMSHYVGLYDCCDCIHGLVGSCVDRLVNACEHYSDELTGRRFEDTLGVRVKRRALRPRKRRKAKTANRFISRKNPKGGGGKYR